MSGKRFTANLLMVGGVLCCLGATNIDPAQKLTWGENVGWINWRDAGGGARGVRVHATFLSGLAWSENVGWINFGDGVPANGTAYANATGADFGVNIDPLTGDLSGLAWGENIGWINFNTAGALGSTGRQARLDFTTVRLRGYAWAENAGWINLDSAARYVAYTPTVCPAIFADQDGDGDVDQSDFGAFQICFSGAGSPAGDGCACFDRPEAGFPRGDNDVDHRDMIRFTVCARGPDIPLDPACGD